MAAGLLADRLFGEVRRFHPLVGFGRWARAVEPAVRSLPGEHRLAGLLAWALAVLPWVALALWLRGTRWREARTAALAALHRVGLQDIAAQNARTLSGGQQQRVALARAWALRPDVLLLDEPTASLDPHAKREVEQLMADLAASQGQAGPGHPVTMVFSSHNLGQVKRLASRVIYLEHGCVLADLPVHDFFNGPLPDAARLFVKGEMV